MSSCAVPSLRSLCVTFLAQNIHRLPEFYSKQANVQPLETSIIMEIVSRAGANMTEASAAVLEALSPYLDDTTDFDVLIWKAFVEKYVASHLFLYISHRYVETIQRGI